MNTDNIGERIAALRKTMHLTQKEFSQLIGVPQPTISSYENGRILPTLEALINISEKCNVTMDWLCGRDLNRHISSLEDIVYFLYDLGSLNEVYPFIEIHDYLPDGDLEDYESTNDESRRWGRMTFYGNDRNHPYNSSVIYILQRVQELSRRMDFDLVSEEEFEISREKALKGTSEVPMSFKTLEELPFDERHKKTMEYFNAVENDRERYLKKWGKKKD